MKMQGTMFVYPSEGSASSMMLMRNRFIEENNLYKIQQKQIQENQRMPPGMASQDLMAYWGTVTAP
jgi:hypothetical protein